MEAEFISSLGKALELIRKGDRLSLGKHPIAGLTVVRRQLAPTDAPVHAGRLTEKILRDLLRTRIRPEGTPQPERIDWRRHTLLDEYVFRHRAMDEVLDKLGVSQALFFQTKKEATELLANELWAAEQQAIEDTRRIVLNIPRASFEFIPRTDELGRDLVDVIVQGLQKRPWVVSIRGYGGVGKTSLAMEASRAAVQRGLFDAVVWADMGRCEPELPDQAGGLVDAIGEALGRREVLAIEDVKEREQAVFAALSERKCLVVIDSTEILPNVRHAQLMQFVRDLPMPTCALIVSREMQRKTELETMIHLEGMSQEEAVCFLRARAAETGMALQDEDFLHLYQTTRGNPLAMLFAVGWMAKSGLPARDVIEPNMFGMSDLLASLLGRVYEKLDEDEERVLNVMPLFSEPVAWPPIAAASGLAQDSLRVKTALGNLRSRFLLDVDGGSRYVVAPLTRMFLQDRAMLPGSRTAGLPATEFLSQARDRLVEHCLEVLQTSTPYQRVRMIAQYRQTLLSALAWCHDNDKYQRLTDLVYVMGASLAELGYWRDKRDWGQVAATAAEEAGDLRRAAWHRIFDVGWTHIQRGELAVATEIIQEALAIARNGGYEEVLWIALRDLAVIFKTEGKYNEAAECLQQSLESLASQRRPEWTAMVKETLGEVKTALGEASEGRRLLSEAHDIYESVGNPAWTSACLSRLALAVLAEGDESRAAEFVANSLSIARTIPHPSRAYPDAVRAQGILREKQGRHKQAVDCFEKSLKLYDNLGRVIMVQEVSEHLDRVVREAKTDKLERERAGHNVAETGPD